MDAQSPQTGAVIEVRDLGLGHRLVPYLEAWEYQRRLHDDVVAGHAPPTLLLLEHERVYTAGKRTEDGDLPQDGSPVVEVDRGGRITWHGPGQLVGYPILPLAERLDVVGYVRALEQMLIDVAADFGVAAHPVPGRSGVWVPGPDPAPERKVAAIGVRVAGGVTMHGFAINCDCALDDFSAIVPCGISDAGVSTLSLERESVGLGPVGVREVADRVVARLTALTPLVDGADRLDVV